MVKKASQTSTLPLIWQHQPVNALLPSNSSCLPVFSPSWTSSSSSFLHHIYTCSCHPQFPKAAFLSLNEACRLGSLITPRKDQHLGFPASPLFLIMRQLGSFCKHLPGQESVTGTAETFQGSHLYSKLSFKMYF